MLIQITKPGTTTTLYDVDPISDKLFRQDPPNAGTLVLIGSLQENVDSSNGFDIGGTSGNAYALFMKGNNTRIYRINTATGKASNDGSLGHVTITGFTIGLGF